MDYQNYFMLKLK